LLKSSLSVLRVSGFAEGISFLLLLGIAMPLKYWAGFPEAVRITGMLHGLLFVIYVLAIALAAFKHRWSVMRILGAFLSAFVPFGPFIFEARLRKNR
jgi:integral membrane protein